jgi:hypothetical protein
MQHRIYGEDAHKANSFVAWKLTTELSYVEHTTRILPTSAAPCYRKRNCVIEAKEFDTWIISSLFVDV